MINNFHNFPQGWEVKTLGEVGKVVSGGTPSTSNKDNFDGEIAWITPADLSGYKEKYISKGKRNLSEQGLKNSSARLLPPNSILFSSRAPIGYVAIASNTLCTNQGFKNLIPNDDVSSEYINYFLLYSKRLAESVASGTTFKEISATNFSKLPIPLPPLETQKAIVEKLENAFAHIDEAVRHLKSVQTNIPRLKSSLLHCAFSGKLTESQNSSHEVQTLKSVVGVEGETLPFEPPHPLIKTEIPQGWEIKTLGEIGKVISGGTPSTSNKDNFDGEIAWITPADLSGYKEKYISKGKRNLSEQGLKNSSARLLPPNSILFSSRAPIGYVAIASNALCTNQGFKNLIPNGNVSSEYIYYFLLHSKRLAESVASGTTFKEISAASFSKLPIPLPPLATQNQIVQILESKFAHLEKLAQFVNASLENLQRLKSSLLNQAFKGELV
ncbi:restriction endonuclease subunit S [Helicobacter ganmani]|uniref:restriction endonuclease subunit S n=1 Tax=Helicobacter ganmani TaxID=60246 RepID=UPI003A8C4AB0